MFWTPARCRLRDEARAFAHDEVLPLADDWFGITIPAEHGGLGLGVSEYCIVAEELALDLACVRGEPVARARLHEGAVHPHAVRQLRHPSPPGREAKDGAIEVLGGSADRVAVGE